jgi:hypothetical protein
VGVAALPPNGFTASPPAVETAGYPNPSLRDAGSPPHHFAVLGGESPSGDLAPVAGEFIRQGWAITASLWGAKPLAAATHRPNTHSESALFTAVRMSSMVIWWSLLASPGVHATIERPVHYCCS